MMADWDLRERCEELDLGGDPVYSATMVTAVKEALRRSDEPALAAPALGYGIRLFCVKFSSGDIRAFINPMVVGHSKPTMSKEHQCGVDGEEWLVPRFSEVDLAYQTPTGNAEAGRFVGSAATAIQQMVDMLDGVLLKDFALPLLEGWDGMPEDDKREVLRLYSESLSRRYDAAKEEVSSDKVAKAIDGAAEFVGAYYRGKMETVPLTEEEGKALEAADRADALAKAKGVAKA